MYKAVLARDPGRASWGIDWYCAGLLGCRRDAIGQRDAAGLWLFGHDRVGVWVDAGAAGNSDGAGSGLGWGEEGSKYGNLGSITSIEQKKASFIFAAYR